MSDYTCFHLATVTPDWKSDDDKSFPHPIHHRPVAACFIRLAADGRALVYTDGLNELTPAHEGALVAQCLKKMPADYATLVGVSLRRFSLPVLYYRALHYGMSTKTVSASIHTTPNDVSVLDDNERNTPALFQLGQLVGFAKRPWLDVAKAWSDGQPQVIVDRLEIDVMLIACVFLRMQFCRGEIGGKQYQERARALLGVFKNRTEFSTQFLANSDVRSYLNVK